MSQSAIAQTTAPAPTSKLFGWWPTTSKYEKWARHIVAILCWTYFVVDLFVYDVDAFLLQLTPSQLAWLIPYKFFVFLSVTAIVLATVSTRRIVAWSIYVFFYPLTRFVMLVFILSVAIFVTKSWPLLFSVLNVLLSFIQSFKQNFVLLSTVIVSTAAIAISNSSVTQSFCALALIIVALLLVVRRMISLFLPSKLFRMYTRVMAGLLSFGKNHLGPDPSVKALAPSSMSKKQLDKWSANLQQAVLYSELCHFLIRKFTEYRKGGLPILYYFLNYVGLLVTIIFLFSIINEGIAHADQRAFSFENGHSYFDFLYYAFATLFQQRVPDLTPVSDAARGAWMIETVFAFLLIVVAISVFFAYKRSVDDAGIDEAIATLASQSASMETFVQSEFSLSLDEAIAELDRLQKGLSKLIDILRAVNTIEGNKQTSSSST